MISYLVMEAQGGLMRTQFELNNFNGKNPASSESLLLAISYLLATGLICVAFCYTLLRHKKK